MTRAAKERTAWAAPLGVAAVLLAAALPALASASAPSPSYAETRVRGSSLEFAAGIGTERALSPTRTEAYGLRYDELAAGYPLVPRGLSDDILRLTERNLTNTGDTVLGSYPGYINKANARGASYFDIGKPAWDALGDDALRWKANQHFLDIVSSRGDRILLSAPKSKIQPNTWVVREVEYLTQERGYVWVNQWSLRPGG